MTRKTIEESPLLSKFWTILAENDDEDGLRFVSMLEAKSWPIWGVQFHPEKPMYEWVPKGINHGRNSIQVYFRIFFQEYVLLNCYCYF